MSLLKRLLLLSNVLPLSFASVAGTASAATTRPVTIKNVILVHGAWADGSSWSKLIPLLQAKGLNVVAVQLPLTSLEADMAATKRAIDNADGPVFLIAHSYGGNIITEAGGDSKVVGLMYIAASAPDVGQSFADLIKPYPPAPALGEATETAGFFRLSPKGIAEDFVPDLPATESAVLAATEGPLAAKAFTDPVSHAAWKTKPTWYIVAANDRVIPVDLERSLAVRMKATTITVPSSHGVMLSHAPEVFAFIESALAKLSQP
jgi:pimeloyl-ACP methyl ester carboxylesterase